MAMPPQVPSTGSSALLQSSMTFMFMSVGASSSWDSPSRSMTVTRMMDIAQNPLTPLTVVYLSTRFLSG